VIVGFLTVAFLSFFYIGYKFGRRVEKWSQNHSKEEKQVTRDGVKDFLNNINEN
jgi:hypothetical protein